MLIKISESPGGNVSKGLLRCAVYSQNVGRPVSGAKVSISPAGARQTIDRLESNSDGRTQTIELGAPPEELSLNAAATEQPYSEYDLRVEAEGFEPSELVGVQILSGATAISNVMLTPQTTPAPVENTAIIKPHTLWGVFPPKIPEPDEKPLPAPTGFVVLDEPVIPETIVVLDGLPDDRTAKRYWVPFREYIKNVASCEIYPTWPRETIAANVLAILSFTLNRVFTVIRRYG
ncbi:MAG: carboxypeptidase-like regulatory domain-containing protein [Defluviitaleaceae bacterium]|nr:carboxypeptidase-like regulatory domain-containing protein [Defluviitaleaceae bacterium]